MAVFGVVAKVDQPFLTSPPQHHEGRSPVYQSQNMIQSQRNDFNNANGNNNYNLYQNYYRPPTANNLRQDFDRHGRETTGPLHQQQFKKQQPPSHQPTNWASQQQSGVTRHWTLRKPNQSDDKSDQFQAGVTDRLNQVLYHYKNVKQLLVIFALLVVLTVKTLINSLPASSVLHCCVFWPRYFATIFLVALEIHFPQLW